MSNRKLTDAEEDSILRWYTQHHYSQSELATIFEVSRSTIRRALSRAFDRAIRDSRDPYTGQSFVDTGLSYEDDRPNVTSNFSADELLEGEHIALKPEDTGINWADHRSQAAEEFERLMSEGRQSPWVSYLWFLTAVSLFTVAGVLMWNALSGG